MKSAIHISTGAIINPKFCLVQSYYVLPNIENQPKIIVYPNFNSERGSSEIFRLTILTIITSDKGDGFQLHEVHFKASLDTD